MKKAPQKLLGKGATPWRLCRQSAAELTEGAYGVGLFGLDRGVPAKSVEVSAAALRFVWAVRWSGQTDMRYDDWNIEKGAVFF